MSAQEVMISGRLLGEPRGPAGKFSPPVFGRVIVSIAVLMLLAASVWAQPPREDPGTAPPNSGGSDEGWQVVRIPGLPANAVLGDVWVDAAGKVYVWANYPARTAAGFGDEPGEGERLPNGGRGSHPRSSTLYQFNGTAWTTMLNTPGETGVVLFGTDATNIYASTNSATGESRLYKFDGQTWKTPRLPGYYLGRTHSMAGTPGDLYFRIDRVLMHDNGNGAGLQPVFEESGEHSVARGMVHFGPEHLFMMCFDGHAVLENNTVSDMPAAAPFGNLQDAWGMRDASGLLHLYALGSAQGDNGVRLWRFTEENSVTHAGSWLAVLADPLTGSDPGTGSGFHLWGAAVNDVYATGVVAGEGHAFHYDGVAWNQLVLPGAFQTVHGVAGTNQGVVWFSTSNGVLLRYQRANRAPDLTAAAPSVNRLWPADDRFVPVDVQGVVDPDGDALTIDITGVLQDEDVATAGRTTVCPDAVVNGSQVLLRAEHAENGDGRTYQINYTATDRLGASRRGSVTVCAPHYVSTPCDVDVALFDSRGPCGVPVPEVRPLDAAEVGGGVRVRYALKESAQVQLGVYDLAGRCIAVLEEGLRAPGLHEALWDRAGAESSVYFIKLRTGGSAFTRRIILLR